MTTTALVAAALLIGTVVSAWQAIEANSARDAEALQRVEADAQRKAAETQREDAERQRKRAEQNLQTAMAAMDDLYRLAANWVASDTEMTDTQRRFLDRAEKFYRAVAANPDEYRVPPRRVAEIHWRIGLINYKKRKFEEAAAALEAAIAIQKTLLAADSTDLKIQSRLASNLNMAGVVYVDMGQRDKAESSYRAAHRHHRSLPSNNPMRQSTASELPIRLAISPICWRIKTGRPKRNNSSAMRNSNTARWPRIFAAWAKS